MENKLRTQELLAQEGLESISQKLYNEIYTKLPGKQNSARRWIWELLQNAKDIISINGKIEIFLTEDSLEFRHNGKPFKHENLLALLSQNSTKKRDYSDDEKKEFYDRLFSNENIPELEIQNFLNITGRFGTGFMTTYLLSKKVTVGGVYTTSDKFWKFSLPFDREVQKDSEMKKKVQESFSSFSLLEKNYSNEEEVEKPIGNTCDTSFLYHLDSDGLTVAKEGMKDLSLSIPYVLAFVKRLNSITITENGSLTVYNQRTVEMIGRVSIEKIYKTIDGKHDKTIIIGTVSTKYDAISIAIPLEDLGDKKYKILPLKKETPKQFISFPLVGSESFPFPVIINSPLFNPDDPRSQVFLDLRDDKGFDKKVNLNRDLFEKSIELFDELLNSAIKYDWEDIHFLAKSPLPKNLKDEWYKSSIQHSIRQKIIKANIVTTESGKKIMPKNALFPIYKKEKLEDFWELCKYIHKERLPRKQDVDIWKSIIESNTKDWLESDFDLSLEKLLKQIEDSNNFSNFNKTYFEDEPLAFKALNEIIQFTEDENKELLNRKIEEGPLAIFPNQTSDSTFLTKKELSRDLKVPKELKDVLKIIGEDWYSKLVRNEILIFERDSTFSVEKASNQIRDLIEEYQTDNLEEEEVTKLVNGLFNLSKYYSPEEKKELNEIHGFLNNFFPDNVENETIEIPALKNFNWKPYKNWAVEKIVKKVSEFQSMNNLSLFLTKKNYPKLNENFQYSEEDEKIMFKADSKLNKVINFVFSYKKALLEKYPIIPNQLNQLCLLNNKIHVDDDIPNDLKKILIDFEKDCRGSLLHFGVSVDLPSEDRNLAWICGHLDDIAINEQENSKYNQAIRDLDKWITKKKKSIPKMGELFKGFYKKRSGIVLNTYNIKERDQFDSILKSGMGSELATLVKSGVTTKVLTQVTNILKEHPEITSEKINELKRISNLYKNNTGYSEEQIKKWIELDELSKGWNPKLKYSPDSEQIRRNFENGWKGEAFVYKQMLSKGFNVDWRNKSENENSNFIFDSAGEKHFILDKGEKYDLIAKNSKGKTFYIQVKTTTTLISEADTIALPISRREWDFVFETKENELYYLARVFNINEKPIVYYMRLEKPSEI